MKLDKKEKEKGINEDIELDKEERKRKKERRGD